MQGTYPEAIKNHFKHLRYGGGVGETSQCFILSVNQIHILCQVPQPADYHRALLPSVEEITHKRGNWLKAQHSLFQDSRGYWL